MARFGVSEIVESIMTYEKNFKDQYNWLSQMYGEQKRKKNIKNKKEYGIFIKNFQRLKKINARGIS